MPGANRYFGSYKINSDETLDARVGEKSIPSEVWDEYQGITRVLIDVHPIVSVYECVTRNGQALFSAIEAIHEEIMTGKAQSNWRTDFVYEVFFTLNQHVANFISSTRAFIDHAEGHLKRTFGENSPEFRNFKQGTAGLYDSHFSYRFLYHIRNYTLHRDLPVSNVNLNGTRDDAGKLKLDITVRLDRDMLLSHFDRLKDQMRREVEALEPQIDLVPMLREQIDWNRELFLRAAEPWKDGILNCSRYFDTLQRRLGLPADEAWVIWEGERRQNAPPGNYTPIPFGNLERIVRLLLVRGPSSALPGRRR
jgi:hypothetical protein